MENTTFQDFSISEEIKQALQALQYKAPTKVQQKVIPLVLEKKDVVVQSQTGSGKTASFAIPLCEVVDWEENKPQVLILTPTRELALQVTEDITNIGRFKRIKATAIFGKQPYHKQVLQLKQKNHMVVGTPGRVLDHLEKGTLSLEKVSHLVLDEADEMLNMGFLDQVESILAFVPKERVTLLFSATLPDDIVNVANQHMQQPTYVEIEKGAAPAITHGYYEVEEGAKFDLFQKVATVNNPDSCIVFCRTQERVQDIYEELDDLGYPVDALHGGMYQEDRLQVMQNFKRGKFRYLVATDVAARGIDIENISLVVNYDIPFEKATYVHRIGRTGRAGKEGKAITFVTGRDTQYLEDIQDYIGFAIPKLTAPTEEEIEQASTSFEKKLNTRPTLKRDKSEAVNQDIMKLYFNGGKKKKIRAVDFVGTIASIGGVEASDIGIIEIQDSASYVDILNGKGKRVLEAMRQKTVKGKKLKVQIARK